MLMMIYFHKCLAHYILEFTCTDLLYKDIDYATILLVCTTDQIRLWLIQGTD